ncbi:unnamed protein product [Prunus brigantina]
MASLKENDLVVRRENEEFAQVETQIAELQAHRDLILQRRDGAVTAETELKSSARQILKAATEKKRALAERKLIRARPSVPSLFALVPKCKRRFSIYRRSPRGPIEAGKICLVAEKICMVESDRGKWVVKSAFRIVKHDGVTPINLGKS